MKRKLIFFVCLIIAGAASYLGSYYLYKAMRPKAEIMETENNNPADDETESYYLGRFDSEMLHIYKMPEETVYESIEIGSLSSDQDVMFHGEMVFRNLTELFEFLENSMS